MTTFVKMSLCPWEVFLNGDSEPLCKHVCATIDVADDVEVVGALPYNDCGERVDRIEILLKKNGKTFRYKIRQQPAETGEPSLQASTALAQLIMNDPLLLRGVSVFECSPTSSFIVFHGHNVDISKYFDGTTLQTSAVVTEIIRQISQETSAQHICSIGMVPIKGALAFLECEDTEDGHRFYEEVNIRKWVSKHNTSPFTRAPVSETDIRINGVHISKQPVLPKKRAFIVTDKAVTKKARTVSNKHICCAWDRSGSMRSMGAAPLDGLKKVVQDQQALAVSSGNPTKMTLYTFDNEMEIPVDNQDISTIDIDETWVEPRGTTRLYDTIVTAATNLKKNVKEDESAVFIVMTDGFDNASESNRITVKNTLETLPDNIECIFMAANIGDAQSVGQTLGFREDTSLTFTPDASQAAFECMSQSSLRCVSGGTAAFTKLERESSVGLPLRARTLL